MDDHVHALFCLSKNHALKKIVEEVKKGSSKWMKSHEGSGNSDFHWQAGYAGFSVSQSNVVDVVRYIQSQAEHHGLMTFQAELRALFARNGVRRAVRVGLNDYRCVALSGRGFSSTHNPGRHYALPWASM